MKGSVYYYSELHAATVLPVEDDELTSNMPSYTLKISEDLLAMVSPPMAKFMKQCTSIVPESTTPKATWLRMWFSCVMASPAARTVYTRANTR